MKKRIERLTKKIEEAEPMKPGLVLFHRGEVYADNSKNKSYASIEAALADNPECEQNIDEVKRTIRSTSSRNLEEAKILAFQKFLSKIK